MFRPLMMGGGGPAGSGWDPNFVASGVALSNNNKTITGPSSTADSLARGTSSRSSGKYSFRVTAPTDNTAGLTNASEPTTSYPGQTANSIGVYHIPSNNNANVQYNGTAKTFAKAASGSPIDVIVDIDARKVWFVVGGTNVFNGGDPAQGTGGFTCPSGAVFPACDPYSSNISVTLDTSTSRYSGFPAWG